MIKKTLIIVSLWLPTTVFGESVTAAEGPSDTTVSVFQKMMNQGNASEILSSFKVEPLENSDKMKVTWVKPNSVAHKAGLKVGDLIMRSDMSGSGKIGMKMRLNSESQETESK